MRLADLHVVVCGAATGGAATALLLARAGARVTLLERVAEPRSARAVVGAGLALAANGLAVLDALGLGPALAAVGRAAAAARVTDAAGRTLVALRADAPRTLLVRRAALQALLLDAVAAEPRIALRTGVEVLAAHPDGHVLLRDVAPEATPDVMPEAMREAARHPDDATHPTFGVPRGAAAGASGAATLDLWSPDASHVVHADLVVGADGVRSRVRDGGDGGQAFGARVRRSGIRYARALVASEAAQGVEAWTPAGVFGSFAVDRGTYCFASCGTPALRAAVAARDLDAFRAEWARAYPPSRPLLDAVPVWGALLVHEVVRVDCARFHHGRLALVGDAAHAMAPNLGQGANSALVDAAVLLDALRAAPDVASALAAYDARRRPAVRRVADAAARLGALSEVTHPVGRALRDRALLPALALAGGRGAMRQVLQEPPERLLAMARG